MLQTKKPDAKISPFLLAKTEIIAQWKKLWIFTVLFWDWILAIFTVYVFFMCASAFKRPEGNTPLI